MRVGEKYKYLLRERGAAGVAFIAFAGAASTAAYFANNSDPVATYSREFASPNGCLPNESPYDPQYGAFVNVDYSQQDDANMLTVVPHDANNLRLSTLIFRLEETGLLGLGEPNLTAADAVTDSFVAANYCPSQTSGQ